MLDEPSASSSETSSFPVLDFRKLSGYFGKKSSIISNKLKDFLEKHKGFTKKRPKSLGLSQILIVGLLKIITFLKIGRTQLSLESN